MVSEAIRFQTFTLLLHCQSRIPQVVIVTIIDLVDWPSIRELLDLVVLYSNQTRRDTRNATVSLSSVGITCRFEIRENQLAKETFRTLKLTARVPAVVEWRRSARSIPLAPVLDGSFAAADAVLNALGSGTRSPNSVSCVVLRAVTARGRASKTVR